jgi:hypothetical protein
MNAEYKPKGNSLEMYVSYRKHNVAMTCCKVLFVDAGTDFYQARPMVNMTPLFSIRSTFLQDEGIYPRINPRHLIFVEKVY